MKKNILLCSFCALLAAATNVPAQGISAGARIWQADWEISFEDGDSLDVGDETFILGYFGYHDGPANLILQAGYGDGWDLDIQRTEFSVAGTLTSDQVAKPVIANMGLAVRHIAYDHDSEDWTYTGLEFLLGGVLPLGESGFAVSASGSLGLYAYGWDAGRSSDDGFTAGYTVDAGLSYALDVLHCGVGYRLQEIQDDDTFAGDTFSGGYIDIGTFF